MQASRHGDLQVNLMIKRKLTPNFVRGECYFVCGAGPYFSLICGFFLPKPKPFAPLLFIPWNRFPKSKGMSSSKNSAPRIIPKTGQEIPCATSGSTPPGLYFACAPGASTTPATARPAARLRLAPSRNVDGDVYVMAYSLWNAW